MGTLRGIGQARARPCPSKSIFPSGREPPIGNSRLMTFSEIEAALPGEAVTSIDLPFPRVGSGKVREIFDLGDALLLVASDRLSAFDVVLPDGIPGKGILLTQMSLWWFERTSGIIENHLFPDQEAEFNRRGIVSRDIRLRSMVVRKLQPPLDRVRRPRLPRRQRMGLVHQVGLGVRDPASARAAAGGPAAGADLHPHHEGAAGQPRRADRRRRGSRGCRRRALWERQGREPCPLPVRPRAGPGGRG